MEAIVLIIVLGGCMFLVARFVKGKVCSTDCGCSRARQEKCGVLKKTANKSPSV